MTKAALLAAHPHCAPCLHEHPAGTGYVYEEPTTKRCHVRPAGEEVATDFVVHLTGSTACYIVAVDNCVLAPGGRKKCDCLVFTASKACFVEIKRGGRGKLGQHLTKGVQQVDATIRRFVGDGLVVAGDVVVGIVSTQLAHLLSPQLTTFTQLARIGLKEAHPDLETELLFEDEVTL